MRVQCPICPHHCKIEEGHLGLCNARANRNGKIVCDNYGKITAIALDPIEKKPLYHFHPGSKILSIGSYGCNLRCPFCQNCDISMVRGDEIETYEVTSEDMVRKAIYYQSLGNIGIAYTYNEPLISYEFVMDCAKLVKEYGMKNVIVTNGYICEEPLQALLPLIDAFNIDLKGFTREYYRKLGGDLDTVMHTIELAARLSHVEVTTLIVPGENDREEEIDSLAKWLAGISAEIPLHITRFFPRYRMQDRDATPLSKVYELAKVAKKHLKFVYEGNC